MLQSAIFASTSGQTAACSFLYSSMPSGRMPRTIPMRFIGGSPW